MIKFLKALFLTACCIGTLSMCKKDKSDEQLVAEKYCGSCHLFPEAQLLTKQSWRSLLPNMAIRLGVKNEFKEDTLNYFDKEVMSKIQLLSDEEWEKIKRYYYTEAPEQLPLAEYPELQPIEGFFEVRIGQTYTADVPNMTCIKIDPKNERVYATDEQNKQIWVLNKKGMPIKGFAGLPAISSVQLVKDKLFVNYIGKDVALTNQKNGYNQLVSIDSSNPQNGELLLKGLYRPVQSMMENIDNDVDLEILTCEFGVNTGKFSVWDKVGAAYNEIVLDSKPGAIQTKIVDWNQDGKQDILTLFSQGDERLMLYINKGNLTFTAIELLKFPPVYGSTSFDVIFNKTKKRYDVVYTCGDNADYSIIPKPYHGVYKYENEGNNRLKQSYFYPLNGATKVAACDFDNDGDIDLAAIAYYANFEEKIPRGFMYFRNNANRYEPLSLNLAKTGRWLVMDIADIDNDNDMDIALGSHPYGELISKPINNWQNSTGVLLLINKTTSNEKQK